MVEDHAGLRPLDVHNLRDAIQQRLLAAILDGTFRPGERLTEVTIAEGLGVSRAPVREALSLLEREGIVVNTPRRGYSVIDFTDKDIEEIYSLRVLLEVGALHRAIERAGLADLEQLQRVVDELGEASAKQLGRKVSVGLDFAFHELICRLADNGRLFNAWNSTRLQTLLLISITSRTHLGHPTQQQALHQVILDAITARDVERASAALTAHLLDAERRARTALAARDRPGGLAELEPIVASSPNTQP